jgi:hypothetical protein
VIGSGISEPNEMLIFDLFRLRPDHS